MIQEKKQRVKEIMHENKWTLTDKNCHNPNKSNNEGMKSIKQLFKNFKNGTNTM